MDLTTSQAETIIRDGAAALQRGDARAARGCFERITATGRANPQVWLLLAHACKLVGDGEAEEAALDRLLAMEPRSLRALIMKGDCRARAGDNRAASSFYKAAQQAASAMGQLPPDLAAELSRVAAASQEADRQYRAQLEEHLAKAGLARDGRSARFQQSLDILFGEKKIFLQQPSVFYFPELPQKQFYDRADFPWVAAVEAATDEMRAELLSLLKEGRESFRPYLIDNPDRPRTDFHGLVDNPDWSTLYLWENGGPVAENVARCPRTFEAMQQVPLPHISVRAPSILFSWLRPGARIPPHTGALNTRLICHLPLIVPPGCGFRVGNETREWKVGEILIFDDTIEHEAWNDSDEDRVVLIFDIWRPELSEDERRAVAAVFEAVDSYQSKPLGS